MSVTGTRIANDYLVVSTPETVLDDYAKRWNIETLFEKAEGSMF